MIVQIKYRVAWRQAQRKSRILDAWNVKAEIRNRQILKAFWGGLKIWINDERRCEIQKIGKF